MMTSGSGTLQPVGGYSLNIDLAGITTTWEFILRSCASGTVTLDGDLICGDLVLESGTFTANGYNVTVSGESYIGMWSGYVLTANLGSGTWTFKNNVYFGRHYGSVVNAINKDTSTVIFDASANDMTISIQDGPVYLNTVRMKGSNGGTRNTITIETLYNNSVSTYGSYWMDGSDIISDPDSVWTNENNATDGSELTYASCSTIGDDNNNYLLYQGMDITVSLTSLTEHPYDLSAWAPHNVSMFYLDSSGTETFLNYNLYPLPGKYSTTWTKLSELKFKFYMIESGGSNYLVGKVYDSNNTLLYEETSYYPVGSTARITRVSVETSNATIPGTGFNQTDAFFNATSLTIDEAPLTVKPSTTKGYYKVTDLTITGTATNKIYLYSDKIAHDGEQTFFESTNAPSIEYVEVKRNNADGNTPFDATLGGVDRGYNTDWDFGDFVPYLIE
jgi:hypothetical protein